MRSAILLVAASVTLGGCAAGSRGELLSEGQVREFTAVEGSEAAYKRLDTKARECTEGMSIFGGGVAGVVESNFNAQTRVGTVTHYAMTAFGKDYFFTARLAPAPDGSTIVKANISRNHNSRWLDNVERWATGSISGCWFS